jgi:hypothetical protein
LEADGAPGHRDGLRPVGHTSSPARRSYKRPAGGREGRGPGVLKGSIGVVVVSSGSALCL